MNILIINWQDIRNPHSGGAEVHLHEIFSRIAAMGHSVTLLCSRFKGSKEFDEIDGIKVIRHGSRNLFNFSVASFYKKLKKKNDYDIVIDDINKIPFYTPLYVKKPLLALSHHFFGKSIFMEAGIFRGLYVYLSEKLVDYIYKKTPFAVVSESTKQEFIGRGFNSDNFTVIYNAINQELYPFKSGLKETRPTIVYFGRLKKYKSVDHLIRAFAKVAMKIQDAQLYILGTGDYRQALENLALKLKIYDKVKFFGFVTEEEKIVLLSASHCAVNTSMKEGWGITNIEVNACALPVISANVPGLKDSVKHGESGLLYEYGNIDELASLIYELLSNDELRLKLCEGAISWAKSFSWDDSARKMLELCEEVIKRYESDIIKI